MKKLLLAFSLLTATLHAELPNFASLPDFQRANHCDAFSSQCLLVLHSKGIPATQIFYKWSAPCGTGAHAAILFQYRGSFYFMDNQRSAPRKVTAKTDRQCVVQVTPKEAFVQLVDRSGRPLAAQSMAARFAKAGI